MKYRFVSLLVTASVICSSLISCDLQETAVKFFTPTLRCPIRMQVNSPEFISVEFSSEEYTFHTFNLYDVPHALSLSSAIPGFSFWASITRDLSSKDGDSLCLYMSLLEEDEFEEGKKYSLVNDSHDHTMISFSIGGVSYYYCATEGWIVFTEYRNYEYLSGEFEFTAIEQSNGNVMEVKNGTFEDLKL